MSKLDLQKLLFLYVQDSGIGHYAFVPYKYGCYSFLARDDMELMTKRGWLRVGRTHVELQSSITGQPWAAESEERLSVARWLRKHELRGEQLIREVYRQYPYYAIRSGMKERLLNDAELEQVNALARVTSMPGQTLFTLGYEGIHFEEYANKLLRNGVRLLCDVRRNPLSRKFGFSGRALAALLPKLGIEYLHLPEMGIASEQRKDLDAEGARKRLFEAYVRELPGKEHTLARVMELLHGHVRIALTCFEQHAQDCHRHCIADRLAALHGVEVAHL